MSAEDLAQVLIRFKQAGGEAFVDEPASTLLTKFVVYKLYEKDWPHMFKRIYTRQSPERLQKQISALRAADRATLVSGPHDVVFASIRSIAMPVTVLPHTYELTVNRRQTGHIVKDYAAHSANIDTIHSGFKSLPADGFLLALADSGTVDSLLISQSGRMLLAASPETIQNTVLPALEVYARTRRNEKISDLCSLLNFSTLAIDRKLDAAFKAMGLIETEKDINEVIPTKYQLALKLAHLANEHRERCEQVDIAKLRNTDYDVEKTVFQIPEISTLSKQQIKGYLADITTVKPILEEYKLNQRGQHQSLAAEIKALLQKRADLMDCLDFRTYYANNPSGTEASHVSRSLRNQTFVQLGDYKQELENYITILSKYQYDPVQERRTVRPVIAYY
jgi:hypothetical protein